MNRLATLLAASNSKIEVISDLSDDRNSYSGLQISGIGVPTMKFFFDKESSMLHRLALISASLAMP